jgi:hypothetical protein
MPVGGQYARYALGSLFYDFVRLQLTGSLRSKVLAPVVVQVGSS